MNCDWKEVKLGDILAIPIRNGLTKPKSIRGNGYKMIGMGEIFKYSRIQDIKMERVPISEKEEVALVEDNDLLFARQSLTLEGAGKCVIVKHLTEKTVFESHLIRVRINSILANSDYIYYYFNSYYGRKKIESIVEQVAAAGIRGSDLIHLKIELPPLEIQKQIAKVLSALDDKIELNNKINENLEQQAQAIFKSWFVDFEPFGGVMPSDWDISTLSSIATFKYGTMPKKDKIIATGYPLFSGYKIVGYYPEKMFDNHQLIIVARGVGGTGDVKYTPENCYLTNLSIAIILNNPVYERYIHQHLLLQDMKILNTGSAQPQITISSLEKFELCIPEIEIIEQYSTLTTPIIEKIRYFDKENQKLTQLRDALLPKLMSGEVDVSSVEV